MNRIAFVEGMSLAIQTLRVASADDRRSLIEPGAKVTKIAGDMIFIEGPVWLPKEGNLVFSALGRSKLMEWSRQEGRSVYRDTPQRNGNANA